ncbi:ribosomal protein S18 acetylase RimI-like enzyme [Bacillus ectoiniformans]|uniref:GNAT family N-acetyltransferase n=1 Tax=Bacillus ectoiniformans TaxID=1494429 RepID=UPI00195C3DA7|nr:GNAT family N-acetyltransferase [Bacillus ectoiniformans]MBM7647748.1 ribosomal protein S18 acetylase RimI-like enzyme [Bacillus ectoiniformans]
MYLSECYCFDGDKPLKTVIRNYTKADIHDLIDIQRECFPPPFPEELWWNEEQLLNHVTIFPEGAFCVEVEGKIVGSMTGLLVNYSPGDTHTWEEITDNGYIKNHDPKGNTLYIVDISVRPGSRKLGLAQKMMQAMYQTVIYKKLDRLLGGGRMPRYHQYADHLTAEEYVNQVITGTIQDPVLTFLLRSARMPVGLLKDYLEDEESHHYALLMEWRNPFK